MCTEEQQDTIVYGCGSCGHLQTPPMGDLTSYYATEYKVSAETPEEDQLYKMVDGQPVYRSPFQADTLLAKVDIPSGARVLDFGAAKGMTPKFVVGERPDLAMHLYDVTDQYRYSWDFIPPENAATHVIPEEWFGSFDVVTSFYVLEHVEDPRIYVGQAAQLLRKGGTFYFVVPNVANHTSDFIVVDHVNHFTEASIRHLLNAGGFEVDYVDDVTHEGAWIAVCRAAGPARDSVDDPEPLVRKALDDGEHLARRWRGIYDRLQQFSTVATAKQIAIYGSSFWGTLIAVNLDDRSNLRQFLDQNPHFHGRNYLDVPIAPPSELAADVTDVLVGLDPSRARDIIAGVDVLRDRNITFHYLEGDQS